MEPPPIPPSTSGQAGFNRRDMTPSRSRSKLPRRGPNKSSDHVGQNSDTLVPRIRRMERQPASLAREISERVISTGKVKPLILPPESPGSPKGGSMLSPSIIRTRLERSQASPSSLEMLIKAVMRDPNKPDIIKNLSEKSIGFWNKHSGSPRVLMNSFAALSPHQQLSVACHLNAAQMKVLQPMVNEAVNKILGPLDRQAHKQFLEGITNHEGELKIVLGQTGIPKLNSLVVGEERLLENILKQVLSAAEKSDIDKCIKEFRDDEKFVAIKRMFKRILFYLKERDLKLNEKDQDKTFKENENIFLFTIEILKIATTDEVIKSYKQIGEFKHYLKNNPRLQNFKHEISNLTLKALDEFFAIQLCSYLINDKDKNEVIEKVVFGYFWFTSLDTLLKQMNHVFLALGSQFETRIALLLSMIKILQYCSNPILKEKTILNLNQVLKGAKESRHNKIIELSGELELWLYKWGIIRNSDLPTHRGIEKTSPEITTPRNAGSISFDAYLSKYMDGQQLNREEWSCFVQDLKQSSFKIFRSITPNDLFALVNGKTSDLIPSLKKSTDHFNQISKWAASCVLKESSSSKRAKVLDLFIELADSLHKENDFNTSYAILAGLNYSFIQRLKETWEKAAHKEIFAKIEEIFEFGSNFKNYKHALSLVEKGEEPFIPIISLFQRDFTFIEEAHSSLTAEGGINYKKLELISQQLSKLIVGQKRKMKAERYLTDIHRAIADCAITEDQMTDLSHKREKRSEKGSTILNIIKRVTG